MKARIVISYLIVFILSIGIAPSSEACDSNSMYHADSADPRNAKLVFFDFAFEQHRWNSFTAREAHKLHHNGHHAHNKTHEEYINFKLGVNPIEAVTIQAGLPYVVRNSIEIHDHDRLGEKETSEGLGDLNLIGIWRFLRSESGFVGVAGGVKFPTGSTDEENSAGERFESELQPGSGSYDYPVGGVYQFLLGPATVHGSVIYVVKTEGDHAFEYGDLFTASLGIDAEIYSSGQVSAELGVELSFQLEDKQIEEGETVEDSGGSTLLLGPSLSVDIADRVKIFGTIQFPVAQNLGGVHQELEYTWSAGAKISW